MCIRKQQKQYTRATKSDDLENSTQRQLIANVIIISVARRFSQKREKILRTLVLCCCFCGRVSLFSTHFSQYADNADAYAQLIVFMRIY